MAMTKKMRVSFDLTLVMDSEGEQAVLLGAVRAAKRVMAGEIKGIDHEELALLKVMTESGPEAAIEMKLRSFIRGLVKEAFIKEAEFSKASPANVHFTK